MELTPITEREFRKKLKGYGIKYYSSLPKKRIKKTAWFLPHPQTTKKSQDKR